MPLRAEHSPHSPPQAQGTGADNTRGHHRTAEMAKTPKSPNIPRQAPRTAERGQQTRTARALLAGTRWRPFMRSKTQGFKMMFTLN